MTASYDIALHDLAIHSAITVDMRPLPLIDVGPIPGACEPTLIGPVAPDRLPFVKATCVLPDLDVATDDDLADLAANCFDNSGDLAILLGSSPHVRAILGLFGRLEMRADKAETLRHNVRQLSSQLTLAQGLGAEFKAKCEDLALQLKTERERNTREITAHKQSIEMLAVATMQEFRAREHADKLEAKLHEAEILRVAALQDLEDMRQVAIRRGDEVLAFSKENAKLRAELVGKVGP